MCYLHLKFKDIFGYGWVFPKKQHVNIGIGILYPKYVKKPQRNILEVYKDYFKTLKENKVLPENLEIGKCCGGALPFSPLDITYSNRLLVVGDAAGFINPITGEGIYYAMSSGEIAAKIINDSLEVNDTSGNYLSKYQDLWKEDFGKDLEIFLTSIEYINSSGEEIIRLASKDKKLARIILEIIHGGIRATKNQGKLIRRFAWVNFKDKLGIL